MDKAEYVRLVAAEAALMEKVKELQSALFEVVDGCAAVDKPWELQGYGIQPKRAEEICELAEQARAALMDIE